MGVTAAVLYMDGTAPWARERLMVWTESRQAGRL